MSIRSIIPHVRGVAVLALIIVSVVSALPMPGPGSERALNDPLAQDELATWVGLLGNVGWQTDNETLGAQVLAVGGAARAFRKAVVTPMEPITRVTQTQQGWGLFAYPDVRPHTLEVQVRPRRGAYETLYRSGDGQHRWRAGWLQHRRVRALYKPGLRPPPGYDGLTQEVARRIFDEDERHMLVRIRFSRGHSTLPGEPVPLSKNLRYLHLRVLNRRDVQ